MREFLSTQLDYVFFFYGLAFQLMALSCFAMGRHDRQRLGWDWLGLFGVAHGINEWLDLGAYSIGDSQGFAYVRTLVMMVSFIFLLEFGRFAASVAFKRFPARWFYAPLIAASLAGAAFGVSGLNAVSRYMLGFTGGMLSAVALVALSLRKDEPNRAWLGLTGLALGLYAVVTGLVVPQAPIPPATIINHANFLEYTGMPVQLVRGLIAVIVAMTVTSYSGRRRSAASAIEQFSTKSTHTLKPMAFVLLLVAGGMFLTDAVGDIDMREFRQTHIKWAKTLAGTIEPAMVSDAVDGKGKAREVAIAHLRTHLMRIKIDIPDCTYVSVRRLVDGSMVLVADGEPEGSRSNMKSGQRLEGISPAAIEDYREAATFSYEHHSKDGLHMFDVATPMFDDDGGMMAQLSIVFDEAQVLKSAALDRLYSIIIVGALCGLGIVFFIAWSRTKESITQAAELKLALMELGKETRLRDMATALGEGVIVTDEDGRVTFMNPEAERRLGYTERELLGADAHEKIHYQSVDGSPNKREDCPTLLAIATRTTRRTEDEHFTRKDGSTFPVAYVSAPLLEEGKVRGAVIAFRDVTREKKATEAIRQSEHSYRTLSGNLPGIVYRLILGEKNEMLFFNEMCLPMTGYTPDELTGDRFCSIEDIMLAQDRSKVLSEVSRAIIEDRPFQVEYRITHRDGGIRHFLERGRPVRDASGAPVCIDGVILDITERKLAEEELQKFRHMVEESGEEFYLIDSEGRLRYVNRRAGASLGYSQDEMRAMRIEDIDPDYDDERFRAHFADVKKKGLMSLETKHRTRDGKILPKEVNVSFLTIGGEGFLSAAVTDISVRKELERQRADFFSMVAHDFKSPLSVIMTYADIIMTDHAADTAGDLADAAKAIKSSSRKLLGMVEDFLAVSRFEAGMSTPVFTRESVAEIAYEVGAAAKPVATRKGIEFEVEGLTASTYASMDKGLIIRALSNLVQNAINYTPEGGSVKLTVSATSEDGRQYASLAVSDTGPGIAPEEHEKVFKKYYRSPGVSGTKGSGLGLTIAMAVAEAHGGSIRLSSAPGQGSTFTLLLPRDNAGQAGASA